MREAIGGSWIIYIAVIFLMIYIFFISFVMNYASAYRAANYIVTQIENCQGEMNSCADMEKITEDVRKMYHYIPHKGDTITPTCIANGNGAVYRVQLAVEFELPLLGGTRFAKVTVETKTIQGKSC